MWDKEKRKIVNRRWWSKLKGEALSNFPSNCQICTGTVNLCLHKTDCKPHDLNKTYQMAIKNPEDFIRLCYACHKGIHFAVEKIGLSWVEIVERLPPQISEVGGSKVGSDGVVDLKTCCRSYPTEYPPSSV